MLTLCTGNMSEGFAVCALMSDTGYVVYSACGSFWVPMVIMMMVIRVIMFIMMMFYARIYRTASRASAAVRRGFIPAADVNTSSHILGHKESLSPSRSESCIALRVHRGGAAAYSSRSSNGNITDRLSPQRHTAADHATTFAGGRKRARNSNQTATSDFSLPQIVVTAEGDSSPSDFEAATPRRAHASSSDNVRRTRLAEAEGHDHRRPSPFSKLHIAIIPAQLIHGSSRLAQMIHIAIIPAQLRSLNRETKAAKTVGVIVGCFIFCWAPFFTVYLLGAVCPGCRTPTTLFDVFFWLGYCNSAANPLIYGLCSRDFRYAFAKLLRCRCERRRSPVPTHTTPLRRNNSRLGTMLRSFQLQIATTSNERDANDSDN